MTPREIFEKKWDFYTRRNINKVKILRAGAMERFIMRGYIGGIIFTIRSSIYKIEYFDDSIFVTDRLGRTLDYNQFVKERQEINLKFAINEIINEAG